MMHNLFLPFTILLLLPGFSSAGDNPFTKIYAFGDSYTDTGNYGHNQTANQFTDFSRPPYGSTYFHHPAHRCSDGRLVIDFLSAALSLPFIPPYLRRPASNHSSCHGVNFAIAFSTSFDDQFLTQNTSAAADGHLPATLSTQLRWFESYLEEENKKGCRPECGEPMDGALFWIGQFGFFDYMFGLTTLTPAEVVRQQSVNNVINFLQEILKKGAKYIFVQGVPPLGCLPIILSLPHLPNLKYIDGCYSDINTDIKAHNILLEEKLQDLRFQFPNAFISYVDIYTAHISVIREFKSNGFDEPFKACCGAGGPPYNFELDSMCGSPGVDVACSQPSKYVNWDGIHLTDAMNKRMAEIFLQGGHCRPPLDWDFVKTNGM